MTRTTTRRGRQRLTRVGAVAGIVGLLLATCRPGRLRVAWLTADDAPPASEMAEVRSAAVDLVRRALHDGDELTCHRAPVKDLPAAASDVASSLAAADSSCAWLVVVGDGRQTLPSASLRPLPPGVHARLIGVRPGWAQAELSAHGRDLLCCEAVDTVAAGNEIARALRMQRVIGSRPTSLTGAVILALGAALAVVGRRRRAALELLVERPGRDPELVPLPVGARLPLTDDWSTWREPGGVFVGRDGQELRLTEGRSVTLPDLEDGCELRLYRGRSGVAV